MNPGQVVEVVKYTPGLWTGSRYVVTAFGLDPVLRAPMVEVRPLGSDEPLARYWAFRFRPVIGEARG